MGPGDVVADRFVIVELAGAGGMAQVFRAVDRSTGAPVALKLMIPSAAASVERFEREVQALARVRHSGVVAYVAHGVVSGCPYLAMDWVDGESLSDRLREEGGLTQSETVRIGAALAEALQVAHAAGVVHRDVKPANVLLGTDGRVVLVDFGVAWLVDAESGLTQPGFLVGTPGYIAPEQARGDADVGAPADVFALGCVLFACLVGRAPYQGEFVARLAKTLFEAPPRVRSQRADVAPELDALIARLMARDVSRRVPSATAAAVELRRLLAPAHPIEFEVDLPGEDAPPPASSSGARKYSVLPSWIGAGEQRPVSVIVAQAGDEVLRELDPTLVGGVLPSETFAQLIAQPDVRVERMADGSTVVAVVGSAAATDLASRAARTALALARELPGVPVALATGRGQATSDGLLGEVIDRAASMLSAEARARPEDRVVRVDPVTAGLIDGRFVLGGDSRGLFLRGARATDDDVRTLLGKPTTCHGRDRELATLFATLDECREECVSRVVVVTGEAGAGKSRVRHELLRRLRERGDEVEVWTVRADPVAAGAPLGLLRDAIRAAAQIQGGEPLAVQQTKLRARVERTVRDDVERVVQFIGEIAAVPFSDESALLREARRDALVMGDNLRRALVDWLAAEARLHPLLLVFEDLHLGDQQTVSFLDDALRSLAESPLLVLALARPEVTTTFPDLWRARSPIFVQLPPLSKRAARALVEEVLGDGADPATTASILERAEGNAFYLEELVRAAVEHRAGLPGTVLAMAQQRLEALPDRWRRLLRGASLFGETFWVEGLAAVVGEPAADVASALESLVQAELITRRSSSRLAAQDELAFAHALVREAAYRMLLEEDRALGHQLVASWLEGAGDADAWALARHFEAGQEPERARELYLRAAHQAFDRNDWSATQKCAEQGIWCGAQGRTRGELRLVQARAALWASPPALAARFAEEARGLLDVGTADWFHALRTEMVACGRLGAHARNDELGESVLAASSLPEAQDARVDALASAIGDALARDRPELAERMFAEVVARPLSPGNVARVEVARGARADILGDYAEQLRAFERALMAAEAIGDRRNVCVYSVNVAWCRWSVGAPEVALGLLERAAQTGRALELAVVKTATAMNLAMSYLRLGRLDDALESAQRALRELQTGGHHGYEVVSRLYLIEIHVARGELDAAALEVERVLALKPTRARRPYAHALAARVALARGELDAALRLSLEAMPDAGAARRGARSPSSASCGRRSSARSIPTRPARRSPRLMTACSPAPLGSPTTACGPPSSIESPTTRSPADSPVSGARWGSLALCSAAKLS